MSAGRRSTISTRTRPRVLLATGNRHKIEEIREILAPFALDWHSLEDFPNLAEPEETGQSYQENAILKARYYALATGLSALADDSGLEVDALQGQPGIHSARFAGRETPHAAKVQRVLELLREVPPARRTARFRCVAAFLEPEGGDPVVSHGAVEGLIHDSPSGSGGFGYDPIFWLPEFQQTMAQLPPATKNSLSHRARALLGLAERLGWPAVD